jgi:hypothetical protein
MPSFLFCQSASGSGQRGYQSFGYSQGWPSAGRSHQSFAKSEPLISSGRKCFESLGFCNTTGSPAAFAGGAVIGALGGLIGLGGAEFRLPLLIGFGSLIPTVLLLPMLALILVVSAVKIWRHK